MKRRFTQGIKVCSSCKRSTVLGNFCSECGDIVGVASVELNTTKCNVCKEEVPDRGYCINCGVLLMLNDTYDKGGIYNE